MFFFTEENTVKQCWDSRENNVANDTDDNICDTLELRDRGIFTSTFSTAVRICFTVLTQPGTPVSFQGMFIHLLFDFWKLWIFQCFPFPENSGTPMFLISGNSRLQHFLILVIHVCISHFTCDSLVSPCFMLLFSLMYSGLLLCTWYNLVPLLSL